MTLENSISGTGSLLAFQRNFWSTTAATGKAIPGGSFVHLGVALGPWKSYLEKLDTPTLQAQSIESNYCLGIRCPIYVWFCCCHHGHPEEVVWLKQRILADGNRKGEISCQIREFMKFSFGFIEQAPFQRRRPQLLQDFFLRLDSANAGHSNDFCHDLREAWRWKV